MTPWSWLTLWLVLGLGVFIGMLLSCLFGVSGKDEEVGRG